MVWFLLMVAAATVFLVRSVGRVLNSRFLHPVDLAIISTYYYTVPIAVFGYFMYNPRNMIFLHSAAADPSASRATTPAVGRSPISAM